MKINSTSKVLITGACGFIGSHLTESLVKMGCQVRALAGYNTKNSWGNLDELDNEILKSVEVVLGNIQDPYLVRRLAKGCDIVFHLAALIGIPYSYVSPVSYLETNVRGTLNVLQACVDAHVSKVIHTSTSETYGTALCSPINEQHPLQGQSPYSASKIAADKFSESYYLSFQLPVATIRPFNTYGPRQSARAVIPTIICQIASGNERIKLGSLSPIRDFNYVADTVAGYIAIAESDRSIGQVINVGSGRGISISDLARLIIKLMKADVEIVNNEDRIRPTGSEVMELLCDNSKARELVGWAPRYTLEQGLQETISYVESNLQNYKSEIYTI